MKKNIFAVILLTVVGMLSVNAAAQTGAKQEPQVKRDADVENDSLHNLTVARHYFKLKKAYVAALQRCEEIIAADPAFSKIDEVLFMAGESSLNLADSKGRQKPSLYVIHEGESKRTLKPEEFKDLARDYLSQLVSSHPNSSFRKQAESDLEMLGGARGKQ